MDYNSKKTEIKLTYQCIQNNGRRRIGTSTVVSEQNQLTPANRDLIYNSVDDLDRNLSLAAWTMDMYINYTSRFKIHINSGNKEFDAKVKRVFELAGLAKNFDISERHSRDEALRLIARSKICYGDGLFIKLKGGFMQGIPGNRIASPKLNTKYPKKYSDVNKYGLVLDKNTGKTLYYCLNRFNSSGLLEYDHFESADNVIYTANYRSFDQSRGMTKFTSIIKQLNDFAEIHEYTRLKQKLHATFGFVFSNMDENGLKTSSGSVDTTDRPQFKVDLNSTPWILQGPPDTKVDLLESKTPSAEYIDYIKCQVRDSLLVFGIPYTYYDGTGASYSSRIADNNQMEYMIQDERNNNKNLLEEYSDWKLDDYCTEGGILFRDMNAAGLTLDDMKLLLTWIPDPSPWIDKSKQIKGDQDAVAMGIDSIPRICARNGLDWRKIQDENAEAFDRAREKDIPTFIGNPGQENVTDTPEDTNDTPTI